MNKILFLICLLSLSNTANAENILGLTLPCESCKVTEDPCELSIGTEIYTCNEGLLKLLKATTTQGPSFSEIRKFLAENDVSDEVFSELLRILKTTKIEANDSIEQIRIIETFLNKKSVIPDASKLHSSAKFLFTQALEQVAYSKFESSRREIAREEFLQNLEQYFANDRSMQQILSILLVHAAQDAVVQAELERAAWLIAKSRFISPQPDVQRDQILLELEQHPLLREKPKIQLATEEIKRKISTPRQLKLFVSLALALWLIFLVSYYYSTKPSLPAREVKKTDSKTEEILKFFDLDENSTEEDLNRNYRKMAKAVHPDVAAKGLNYDFHKLQDMFEQARRIVFKIK